MMLPPRLTLTITLLTFLAAFGCVHRPSPHMPDDWPRLHAGAENLGHGAETPRLQVIIGYFDWWPNHAALRLVAPERPVVFWDPGGGYGRKTPRRERIRDVIVDGAPDIPTYMPFRWFNNDALTEIFEWALSDEEALRMHRVLMAGAGIDPDPAIDFDTDTPGFFCAAAISEFLHRFGAPTIHIAGRTVSPARLSHYLYQQHPDRVLLFYRHERPRLQVMTRPPTESPGRPLAREGGGAVEGVAD
jgi:hypothetical protein